jgi:hypothetical protein
LPYVSQNRVTPESITDLGWLTQTTIVASGIMNNFVATEIDSTLRTPSSLIGGGATDYYIKALVVNLPYLDGAKPFALDFWIAASMLSSGSVAAIRIAAFTQDDLLSREYTYTSTPIGASQYTINNITTATLNTFLPGSNVNMRIDLSNIASNYTALTSSSRTLPIYLFFLNASNSWQPLEKTNDLVSDQITIQDMNGWFNY